MTSTSIFDTDVDVDTTRPTHVHALSAENVTCVLFGFWSLGEMLEIRSHLPGQKPHRLILHRDLPDIPTEGDMRSSGPPPL